MSSEKDPIWFQNAVIYELHVRSFYDSNGDGIGDFRGLREKLSYFEDLGVTALWLLPFYPSPLLDDGYDIADYLSIHPSYGTLDDFCEFLQEAHRRGLRVITELVLNHTSDQHPWFQRSRLAAPGTLERDFYTWSDTPRRYEEARILFGDFETSNWAWDPVAQAYYWHRFYSHQPDLNFDNPLVQQAILDTLDFWLELGVDGLRLDAVPYLFAREGTSCENLPETHAFLRKLRKHMDQKFPCRMLLAEANQWPEDAAAYFGNGDECHMEFHFPLMPRLFMALQMEDCFPLIDILEQTPPIPKNCQWAIFLRNHDELTLEMVSDEERDYMVRLYAEDVRARINLGIRRRLAPLLNNNRRKIELMTSLLLSLPGTPILYYGDEIGMGDNFYLGDRNGVRTPMQWSADRNAGFSRANPQQLFLPVIIDPEFHYETVNVDVQKRNLSSLFWWTRRILSIRQKHAAFAYGDIQFVPTENSKVLAYLRRHGDQILLVVANLSRFSQPVSLDLSGFCDWHPEELFGNTRFPAITNAPYLFTLGPHGFYWLHLHKAAEPGGQAGHEPCLLNEAAKWTPELEYQLEHNVLPRYIRECRWFGEKQRLFREAKIVASFSPDDSELRILLVEITFTQGRPATYVLPVLIAKKSDTNGSPQAAIARFASGEFLWDAIHVEKMRQRLLRLILKEETWRSGTCQLIGLAKNAIQIETSVSRLLGGEQSNSTIVFSDQLNLKLIRHYEAGPHPDTDLLKVLEEQNFPHVPRYRGEILCMKDGRQGTIGLLTSYVPNQGDAWTYTVDALSRYFEQALALSSVEEREKMFPELMAGYPERARQLGVRTGELHHCLGKLSGKDFAPESFTSFYQRSLYQTLRSMARRTEFELARKAPSLSSPSLRDNAKTWISEGPRLLAFYRGLLDRKIFAKKIRVHGDYHLGQVLNTGKDFIILDFEGEPRRTLGERLLKRAPLVDIAGMLRSFDYAIQAALTNNRSEDQVQLAPWAKLWREMIVSEFLDGYLAGIKDSTLLPQNPDDFVFLLNVFLLDKAIYEIGYELHYRPDQLSVPLQAALHLIQNLEDNKLISQIFNRFSETQKS
ncbi:MAG: maltose alpha-D-glucosyltransferase [Verrucomicrobia bacterium]|nr:MAG: maltose alpha-D-glucosyltransferase [Verrucomicrobiota bacterium]